MSLHVNFHIHKDFKVTTHNVNDASWVTISPKEPYYAEISIFASPEQLLKLGQKIVEQAQKIMEGEKEDGN